MKILQKDTTLLSQVWPTFMSIRNALKDLMTADILKDTKDVHDRREVVLHFLREFDGMVAVGGFLNCFNMLAKSAIV